MSSTRLDTFDETLQKTDALLRDIDRRRGWIGHRNISYHALRSVLHTLRDRLAGDETAHFAARLPVLVRGMYYEGWKPSRVPVKLDAEEFIVAVRARYPYGIEGDVADLVADVLGSLATYVTEGEIDDVLLVLPNKPSSKLKQRLAVAP